MSLSKSQLYYIKKAKARKTKVIMAAVNRVSGSGRFTITNRIIKNQINKELYRAFNIVQIAVIPEEKYERALDIIKKFRMYYGGDHYG